VVIKCYIYKIEYNNHLLFFTINKLKNHITRLETSEIKLEGLYTRLVKTTTYHHAVLHIKSHQKNSEYKGIYSYNM
jgi:hypothetical protein